MLYGPHGDMLVTSEWEDLGKRITHGDGIFWAGDPRLYLGIGVVTARDEFGNERRARRLEVWRWNEDGSDTLVGHWRMDEAFRITKDLAEMRVDSPGHVSVIDRIDKHNEALEKKASDEFRDAMGALLEHAAKLHHDLNEPKNTFYMSD